MSVNAREFARGRAYGVVVGLACPAGAAVPSTNPQVGPTSVQTMAEADKSCKAAEAVGEAADADRSRPQLSLLQPRHPTARGPSPMIPLYLGQSA